MSEARNDLVAGIGHNRPTLDAITGELLDEELLDDRREADLLLQRASTSLINDVSDAAGVQLIGAKIKTLSKKIDDARKARGEPYRQAVLLINDRFGAQTKRLDAGAAELEKMLGAFKRKQDEEAAAARAKAEEEARRRQEEAEAAQARLRAAEEPTLMDKIALQKAQEDAEVAARRAATIRPAPIPVATGSVASKKVKEFEIVEFKKVVPWLAKSAKAQFVAAITELVRRQVAAIPISQFEQTTIPGVKLTIREEANIRAR